MTDTGGLKFDADKARQAYNYAEIVMRPLEPWERQALEDFRTCVHRWHEKACAKGYDGVEAMCDTAPAFQAPGATSVRCQLHQSVRVHPSEGHRRRARRNRAPAQGEPLAPAIGGAGVEESMTSRREQTQQKGPQ